MGTTIPDKTYFKIGEAASLVGVKPYIVRYWEKEFRGLRPSKTKSGQRLFRRKDIQLLFVIRALLYEQRFTIEGARRRIKEMAASGLAVEDMLEAMERPLPAAPDGQGTLPIGDAGAAVDELRGELDAARSESARAEAELTSVREELSRATAARAELDEALSAARRDLSTEADARAQLEVELASARDANRELEENLESVRSGLADANEGLARAREQGESATVGRLAVFQQRIETLNEENARLAGVVDHERARAGELTGHVVNARVMRTPVAAR